jgi:hypothetical protein
MEITPLRLLNAAAVQAAWGSGGASRSNPRPIRLRMLGGAAFAQPTIRQLNGSTTLSNSILKDSPGFFIPCLRSRQKFKLLCELIAAGQSQPTSLHF